jgi:hypothetical protein
MWYKKVMCKENLIFFKLSIQKKRKLPIYIKSGSFSKFQMQYITFLLNVARVKLNVTMAFERLLNRWKSLIDKAACV